MIIVNKEKYNFWELSWDGMWTQDAGFEKINYLAV